MLQNHDILASILLNQRWGFATKLCLFPHIDSFVRERHASTIGLQQEKTKEKQEVYAGRRVWEVQDVVLPCPSGIVTYELTSTVLIVLNR